MMQAGMEIPQLRPNRQRLTHAPVELHCNSKRGLFARTF